MTSTRHEQVYHAARRRQAALLSLTASRLRGLNKACQVEGEKTACLFAAQGRQVIELSQNTALQGLYNAVLDAYIGVKGWMGLHRIKAYGFLEVAFKVGRAVTTARSLQVSSRTRPGKRLMVNFQPYATSVTLQAISRFTLRIPEVVPSPQIQVQATGLALLNWMSLDRVYITYQVIV